MGLRTFFGLCEHDWKITKRRFIPGVKRGFETTGFWDEYEIRKLVSGYTIRTWECTKCKKGKTDTVIGDDRANVETYDVA